MSSRRDDPSRRRGGSPRGGDPDDDFYDEEEFEDESPRRGGSTRSPRSTRGADDFEDDVPPPRGGLPGGRGPHGAPPAGRRAGGDAEETPGGGGFLGGLRSRLPGGVGRDREEEEPPHSGPGSRGGPGTPAGRPGSRGGPGAPPAGRRPGPPERDEPAGGGGFLGGLRSRLPGSGRQQDDEDDEPRRPGTPPPGGRRPGAPTQADEESGGFLGGLRSRLPFGGAKDEEPERSGKPARPGLPGSRPGGGPPGASGGSRPGGLPGRPGRPSAADEEDDARARPGGGLPGARPAGGRPGGGLPGSPAGSRPGAPGIGRPGSGLPGSRPGGRPSQDDEDDDDYDEAPARPGGKTGTRPGAPGVGRPGTGLPGSPAGSRPGAPGIGRPSGGLPGSRPGGRPSQDDEDDDDYDEAPARPGGLPGSRPGAGRPGSGLPGSPGSGRPGSSLPGGTGASRPGGLPGRPARPGADEEDEDLDRPPRPGGGLPGASRPGGLPGSPATRPGGGLPGSTGRPGGLPGSTGKPGGLPGARPGARPGATEDEDFEDERPSRLGGLPGSRPGAPGIGRPGSPGSPAASRPGGAPSKSPARPGGLPGSIGAARPGGAGERSPTRPGGAAGRSPAKPATGGKSPTRTGGLPGGIGASSPARPGGAPARSTSPTALPGGIGTARPGAAPIPGSPTRPARGRKAPTPAKKGTQADQPLLSLDTKLDILGVALIAIALITFLSFLSKQPGSLTATWLNIIGQLFGWPGYIIPFPIAAVGVWLIWRHFGNQLPPVDPVRIGGAVLLFVGVAALIHAITTDIQPTGAVWLNPALPPEQAWAQAEPYCDGEGASNAEHAAQGWYLQYATLSNFNIASCGWGGGYTGYLVQNTVGSLLGNVTVYLVALAAVVGGGMMAARLTFAEALEYGRRGVVWLRSRRSASSTARTGAAPAPASEPGQPGGPAITPARGAAAAIAATTPAAAPAQTGRTETTVEAQPEAPPTPGRPSIVTGKGPAGTTPPSPAPSPSQPPAPNTSPAPDTTSTGTSPVPGAAPSGSLAIPPRPGSPKPTDSEGASKPPTSGAPPTGVPASAPPAGAKPTEATAPKPAGAETASAGKAGEPTGSEARSTGASTAAPGAMRPVSVTGDAVSIPERKVVDEDSDEENEEDKSSQPAATRPGLPQAPGSGSTPRPSLPPVPGSRPGQSGSGTPSSGAAGPSRPGAPSAGPGQRPSTERTFGPTPPPSIAGARPAPKPGMPGKPASSARDEDDELFDDLDRLRDEVDDELDVDVDDDEEATLSNDRMIEDLVEDEEDEDGEGEDDDDDDGGGRPPSPSGARPGGPSGSPLPPRPGTSPSGPPRPGGTNPPRPTGNPGSSGRPLPPAPGFKPGSQSPKPGDPQSSASSGGSTTNSAATAAPVATLPSFKPSNNSEPTRTLTQPGTPQAEVAAARPVMPSPSAPTVQVASPPKVDSGTNKSPKRDWKFPPADDLLNPSVQKAISDEELRNRAKTIEQTLSSFGAPGRVVEVNRGPVITQFGVEPDYIDGRAGKKIKVKVGKISALSDDLALSLAAPSIRIEAPVPGKGYVGIEVPNAEPSVVSLRDVIDTPEFRNLKGPLKLALGQDVSGGPIVADLSAMPHLLIAGTTGSGKSVCVNGIICTMLLTHTPEDLKMIMVDPKRVELTNYNGIPHLMAPVVTELERIVGVLKWVQREMDERYRAFAMAGARNITDYNGRVEKGQVKEGKRLPYMIVIVDELADLMMLAPDETERVVTRLAQMARATGIHIILSTQRPSVDVVTGLIKANFPARIAFAVATGVDSRVILDMPGAEKLLGRGDMLFQAPDAPQPIRMQGVFVSDKEIQKIVDFWRAQAAQVGYAGQQTLNLSGGSSGSSGGATRFSSSGPVVQTPLFENGDDDEGDADALFDEAVELVRSMEKASISLLQRHLRIGYTRSARLIDLMEERGVIGPSTGGSKPRAVLGPDGQPIGDVSDEDEDEEEDETST